MVSGSRNSRFQVREILGLVSRFGLRFVKQLGTVSGSRMFRSGFLGSLPGSEKGLYDFRFEKCYVWFLRSGIRFGKTISTISRSEVIRSGF
jgi:hypothetical protein